MADTPSEVINVLVVDDHVMFAESLARLLDDEDGLKVVGLAASGAAALEMFDRLRPDVVLVDYRMPDHDGVEITEEIKQRAPHAMVVMLTGSADDRVLLAAIEAGCSGFLTKDRAAAEVADAVRSAAAGEALITPAMLARLLPKLARRPAGVNTELTAREREVIDCMARGWSNKDIAAQLFLSVNTVRNYTQSILAKLGAHSKLEAVSKAVREGLVEYPAGR
ncbi:MAG TPA: response regulator transcription factor [Mycobacteriales bacterium]|nr:response regulator transcription factor [Mycobacteriales bacterium]